MINPDDPGITRDYFYKKKIIVYQHKNGFRFSVDAPILADFLPSHPTQEALEVGTGVGIVALLALYKKKFSTIYGLEIQPGLGRLAQFNAEKNGFSQNLAVQTADFNDVYRDFTGIRHIFSNPPYFETFRGHLSPNPEIRDARTETRLTLPQLLCHSFAILGEEGNLYLVLPYARYKPLMKLLPETGCFVARVRRIFSFKDRKPGRFLIQLTNTRVSPVELPPLIIFKEKGVYTDEMDKILTG
jgi:tRNA1Val (adenine37-N6)-methyltransferase